MWKHYYYNKRLDEKGNHEVHTSDCRYKPDPINSEYIGYFPNCRTAIAQAIKDTGKRNFDGCYYCCRECHRG